MVDHRLSLPYTLFGHFQDTSSSTPGRSLVLHFAALVPPPSQCPLRIRYVSSDARQQDGGVQESQLSNSNSYFLASWGVVFIYNPPECTSRDNATQALEVHAHTAEMSDEALRTFMSAVVAHLRTMLGLPATPPADIQSHLRTLPSRGGFSEWEVGLLVRRRITIDMAETAATLSQLVTLADSLPGMMIKQEIVDGVSIALNEMEAALTLNNASCPSTTLASVKDTAERARQASEEVRLLCAAAMRVRQVLMD